MAIYRLESAEELLIPPTHPFGALRGGRRGLLGCPAGDRGLGGVPRRGGSGQDRSEARVELVETTGAGAAAQA